jgi:outer membrane protein OmpA-like peptidoglycan-associated protein
MIRILILLFMCTSAAAQVRFDAGIGLAFPSASTSFRSLPGFPSCCPEFTGGSGTGITLGIGADVDVVGNFLVSGRLSTTDMGHTLETQERVSVIIDGSLASADITHSLDLSQRVVAADLLLGYRLNIITVRLGLGYLTRGPATLQAEERLESPAGAEFIDTRTSVRNAREGALPQAVGTSWQLAASIGIDFSMDGRRQWMLSPEIGLVAPLSSITSAVSWKLTVPMASVRLSWSPFTRPEPVLPQVSSTQAQQEPTPDISSGVNNVVASTAPVATVMLDVVGSPTVTIEEVEQETYLPVLPYVFFATDADVLPERYTRVLRQDLPTTAEASDVFHTRLLRVVAERLVSYPQATVTLVGTTSARDRDGTLSGRRARAVAAVLTDSFGIDAGRIQIQARGLPENPSKASGDETELADEENCRVEITSSDDRIIMPYHVVDTTVQMSPPQLEVVARTSARQGIRSWTLSVNDTELRSSEQVFAKPVVFRPTQSMVRSLLNEGEIRFRLDGDVDGVVADGEAVVPLVAQRLFTKRQTVEHDSIVEVFELIVFPYNSSAITRQHQLVLDLVRERIGTRARTTIEGRTDIIGAAEANSELSQRRAQAVADYLQGTTTVTARGEPAPGTVQVLPEQRMLERTVRIRALVPTTEP